MTSSMSVYLQYSRIKETEEDVEEGQCNKSLGLDEILWARGQTQK